MYLYGGLPRIVAFGILVLFSLYLALYHALFALLFGLLLRSPLGLRGALLLTPFVWTVVELARARITGFPWDLLGYAQTDNLLLTRFAPIGGVLALSFVIAACNAALTTFVLASRKKHLILPAAAIIFVLACELLGRRSISASRLPEPHQLAVLMQENLEVGVVGREVKPLTLSQEIDQFSTWSRNPEVTHSPDFIWSPSSANLHPTLIVWPEAPSHLLSNDPFLRRQLTQLALATGAPLIIGTLGVDTDSISPRGYFLYDSASLFDRSGQYQGRYDKIHLVPWGEYVPFKRFFAFAQKLTEGVGDMDRGRQRTVFQTAGHTYGIFVCYESIFGNEVRQFVQSGAEVLVNISDDGWYGDSGAPWQHLNMARMRAIENNRWVLRSTNTGITTAIDPLGRVTLQAPRHIRAAFALPFAFTQGLTFYTRHGDWFAYLCATVTLLSLGYSLKPRMS